MCIYELNLVSKLMCTRLLRTWFIFQRLTTTQAAVLLVFIILDIKILFMNQCAFLRMNYFVKSGRLQLRRTTPTLNKTEGLPRSAL